jgi:hypothetical protein
MTATMRWYNPTRPNFAATSSKERGPPVPRGRPPRLAQATPPAMPASPKASRREDYLLTFYLHTFSAVGKKVGALIPIL